MIASSPTLSFLFVIFSHFFFSEEMEASESSGPWDFGRELSLHPLEIGGSWISWPSGTMA